MGQIAGRVTLKEVVKVTDVITLMRTQRLGQKYMRDLLFIFIFIKSIYIPGYKPKTKTGRSTISR